MKKMIFLLIPIFSFFFVSAGYSDDNLKDLTTVTSELAKSCNTCEPCCKPRPPPCPSCKECEICPPCEPCNCCTEVPSTGVPRNCAYNAPARIDPACGWKTLIEGSFIYWQAKETGLDPGFVQSQDPPIVSAQPSTKTSVTFDDKIIDFDFDYHPGFKIGAGISFKRDDWTLYLEYTRLKSHNSTTKDLGNDFLFNGNYLVSYFLANLLLTKNLKYIKSNWELSYNIFDLELGRPYYFGQKAIFKPHFGLRSGWIDQKYNVNSYGFTSTRTQGIIATPVNLNFSGNQDTWLIGPRAGVDSDWLISCNFRIFANVGASLSYQQFKVKAKSEEPVAIGDLSSLFNNEKNEISRLTPDTHFELGLGYGRYFCNNQWYFDLTVGYDFHYFWNQNEIRYLISQTETTMIDGKIGDLMLHGLTITGRLDF